MRQVINAHRGLKYYGKYLYKDDDEAQKFASKDEVVRENLNYARHLFIQTLLERTLFNIEEWKKKEAALKQRYN